jgi:hypothetical protein
LVAPTIPPFTLLALAQLTIELEDNEDGNNALISLLVFSVEDSLDRNNYPSRDWTDIYNQLAGRASPEIPDLSVDVYKINELLPLLKGVKT